MEVQVSSYFFLREGWVSAVLPTAHLTGPRNSAAFTFTDTDDISGTKDSWHKYEFALEEGDEVTLRLSIGGTTIFSRTCTVDARALEITYAEFIAYGEDEPGHGFLEAGPLPPAPSAHCACGFQEFTAQQNAVACGN